MRVISTLALAAGLVAAGFAPSVGRAEINHTRMLWVIEQVEGAVPNVPGSMGERGPYQISRGVWAQHTRMDFQRAYEPAASRQVALLHLRWITDNLKRRGFPITPYRVGACWNGGLAGGSRRRLPQQISDYAARCQNLYESGHGQ